MVSTPEVLQGCARSGRQVRQAKATADRCPRRSAKSMARRRNRLGVRRATERGSQAKEGLIAVRRPTRPTRRAGAVGLAMERKVKRSLHSGCCLAGRQLPQKWAGRLRPHSDRIAEHPRCRVPNRTGAWQHTGGAASGHSRGGEHRGDDRDGVHTATRRRAQPSSPHTCRIAAHSK
jgi:hypothetical protein